MARQGVFGGVLAIVVLLGAYMIAVCSADGSDSTYQYALNYGEELSDLEKQMPVKSGLAFGFYAQSCPHFDSIIESRVQALLKQDAGVAAGLVRLVFHDCFVQGCDASILLNLTSGSELAAVPNRSIRKSARQAVDDIKGKLESLCKGIVSCADIVVRASAVAVRQSGGPNFNVPLGRRDSLSFSPSTSDLPGPQSTYAQLLSAFTSKGLGNAADIVALSGAHTLGVAFCNAFNSRLLPTVDPKLNKDYANYLIQNVCPTLQSTNSTGLDFYSPNHFDNQYFKNLPTGGALMSSDQNLDQDTTSWNLVNQWASNQQAFFNQFALSFAKMVQAPGTLTGSSGEIRKVCSTTNSGKLNTPLNEPEPRVEHILTTPTYTRPSSSESDLISMVTEARSEL